MNIGQQQHLTSLRYFLYDRPLHPELFEIHMGDRLVRRHYQASLWVTGCSHVIGFFAKPRDRDYAVADGIRYMMNFQVESMSERVYAKTHHDLARQGAKRGLFVPFPMWMKHPPLTPFSYLDYDAQARHLHVFAYHAFPDELTLVKIQSIFELP
ncbi:MAG: DUF2617 family protein [Planctomycetota bacterium]|jgi:hypothetical protein